MKQLLAVWFGCTLWLATALNTGAQPVWLPTNGPDGGTANSLLSCRNGDLFAVMNHNLIVKVTDHEPTLQRAILPSYENIAQLAEAPNGHLYALGSNFYRSTDRGVSWTRLSSFQGYAVCVDDSGAVIVSADTNIYRSTNEGDTWLRRNQRGAVALFRAPHRSVIAITNNTASSQLLKTTDGGITWNQVFSYNSRILGFTMADSVTWYLSIESPSMIFRTQNAGLGWSPFGPSRRAWELAAASNGYLYAKTSGIERISPAGTAWEDLQFPEQFNLRNATLLKNQATGNVLASGINNGLYEYTGSQWQSLMTGIRTTAVQSIASYGRNIYASVPGRIVQSTDNGTSWNTISTFLYSSPIIATTHTGALLYGNIGTNENAIQRSINNGAHWDTVATSRDKVKFLTAPDGNMYINRGVPNTVRFSQIIRSTDDGLTWYPVFAIDNTINAFTVSSHGVVFAAVGISLYRYTPSTSTTQEFPLSTQISDMSISDSGTAICVANRQLVRLSETGYSFTTIAAPFANKIVRNRDGRIYLASGSDYYTTDSAGWITIDSGATASACLSFAFDPVSGYIFSGTDGDGVYRTALPTVGVASSSIDPLPTAIELLPVYPNPFNSSTVISIALPSTSPISLDIYDNNGRFVQQIWRGNSPAGVHRFIWNAGNSASGTYYARLASGRRVSTKAIQLIK